MSADILSQNEIDSLLFFIQEKVTYLDLIENPAFLCHVDFNNNDRDSIIRKHFNDEEWEQLHVLKSFLNGG